MDKWETWSDADLGRAYADTSYPDVSREGMRIEIFLRREIETTRTAIDALACGALGHQVDGKCPKCGQEQVSAEL